MSGYKGPECQNRMSKKTHKGFEIYVRMKRQKNCGQKTILARQTLTNKSKTYGSFRLSHPSHGQTGGSKDPCPDNMPTLEMDSGDITDAIAKAEQANLEQMSKD
mgnify:CR=1 FL=1